MHRARKVDSFLQSRRRSPDPPPVSAGSASGSASQTREGPYQSTDVVSVTSADRVRTGGAAAVGGARGTNSPPLDGAAASPVHQCRTDSGVCARAARSARCKEISLAQRAGVASCCPVTS